VEGRGEGHTRHKECDHQVAFFVWWVGGGGNTRTWSCGHVLLFGTCGGQVGGLWEARSGTSACFLCRETGWGWGNGGEC